MIQFRANFFSETLGISTSAMVLLPQRTAGQIGLESAVREHTPVLYLLHGYSDDDTIWMRRTSIERYASDRGLAVVMPNGGTSFYCNEVHGKRYWDFLSDELPTLVKDSFNVSVARGGTLPAGACLGGGWGRECGVNQPERFAAAGSLSGAIDMRQSDRLPGEDEAQESPIWGKNPIDGTLDDLVHLVGTADKATLPRLWLTCGTEDFLVDQNKAFITAAEEAGVPLEVDWQPGEHEWGYWDRTIQQFLAFAFD